MLIPSDLIEIFKILQQPFKGLDLSTKKTNTEYSTTKPPSATMDDEVQSTAKYQFEGESNKQGTAITNNIKTDYKPASLSTNVSSHIVQGIAKPYGKRSVSDLRSIFEKPNKEKPSSSENEIINKQDTSASVSFPVKQASLK